MRRLNKIKNESGQGLVGKNGEGRIIIGSGWNIDKYSDSGMGMDEGVVDQETIGYSTRVINEMINGLIGSYKCFKWVNSLRKGV